MGRTIRPSGRRTSGGELDNIYETLPRGWKNNFTNGETNITNIDNQLLQLTLPIGWISSNGVVDSNTCTVEAEKLDGFTEKQIHTSNECTEAVTTSSTAGEDHASTTETGKVPTCREIDPKIKEGFKFKKKGKFSKREENEIKRTHRSLGAWLATTKKGREAQENMDEEVAQSKEMLEKEKKLEKVKRRKLEWMNRAMCRSITMDVVLEVARMAEMVHCVTMVQEMVNMAWLELETRRLVEAFIEADERVQLEAEKRIRTLLLENKSLVRESKLEAARRKKEKFISANIGKSITLELVEKAVVASEESHCADMVLELMNLAWLEVETSRMKVSMDTEIVPFKPDSTMEDVEMNRDEVMLDAFHDVQPEDSSIPFKNSRGEKRNWENSFQNIHQNSNSKSTISKATISGIGVWVGGPMVTRKRKLTDKEDRNTKRRRGWCPINN